jgi:hypothetical protein
VYIHEAHPTDGWVVENNTKSGVDIAKPRSLEERRQVAATCATRLDLTMPVLTDGMDNAVDRAFNAWPERLYVISTDGTVAYQGGKGPYGFDPVELDAFLTSVESPSVPDFG